MGGHTTSAARAPARRHAAEVAGAATEAAMEEAGEFAQACSKVYRHNGGKHELKCLSEEVGDLQAMINLLTEAGYVDLKRAEKKRVSREKKHRRIN